IQHKDGTVTEIKAEPGTTIEVAKGGEEIHIRASGSTGAGMIAPSPVRGEPPPLEEWLEGRTVLTVAQDGTGQYKTIQAALNALKTGQVVKVLDRGPYREYLRPEGL